MTKRVRTKATIGEKVCGKSNTTWTDASVSGVLRNERYCGDVLARKTWTPDFHDHKSKVNKDKKNKYNTSVKFNKRPFYSSYYPFPFTLLIYRNILTNLLWQEYYLLGVAVSEP